MSSCTLFKSFSAIAGSKRDTTGPGAAARREGQSSLSVSTERTTLRRHLRHKYTELLNCHIAHAVQTDVPQRLWKNCFYKQIEEFRKVRQHTFSSAKPSRSESKQPSKTTVRHTYARTASFLCLLIMLALSHSEFFCFIL
jgi:hypothetical protein